jgi:hypothetical protein
MQEATVNRWKCEFENNTDNVPVVSREIVLDTKWVARFSLQLLFETFSLRHIVSEIRAELYVGFHVNLLLNLSNLN